MTTLVVLTVQVLPQRVQVQVLLQRVKVLLPSLPQEARTRCRRSAAAPREELAATVELRGDGGCRR